MIGRWLKSKVLSFVPVVASGLLRCWEKSCSSISVINGELEAARAADGLGCVYVTWHQRLFNLYFIRHRRLVTIMISRSKDGDLAAGVADKFGFGAVR